MNKNLIIKKLNKCNAYQYEQNPKPLEESTSKISTSTKTQQSPTLFTLNPEFTFKATDFKEIFLPKPKVQHFFQNFNPSQQIIYQKVILSKCKTLERSLEFQLMNLARQDQNSQDNFQCRKLQFIENQNPSFATMSVMQKIQMKQQSCKIPEYIKTEYNQVQYTQLSNQYQQPQQQEQYPDYYQNVPYDSKKYKLSRQKISQFKQQNMQLGQKRCQTQTHQSDSYEPLQVNNLITYQSQLNQKDYFDDYHFVKMDIKQTKREPIRQFNDYYINGNLNLPIRNHETNSSVQKTNQSYRAILFNRKSGNSSRLSFFRKERQNQFRKSLLEEFNGQNNSKRSICSNSNKQNIKSNIKFVPTLAFNNLSRAADKKLKNQYSQRFLLGRRHLQDASQSKITLPAKGSVNCMSKQTQDRIMSIRKQLREIYQVQQKEKCRLKIMRDQQSYQNNARNSLRRIGSINKF